MTPSPVVAAVLVTHNSGHLLEETLESIDNQSRRPDLRIAVDDYSHDNTRVFLERHGFAVDRATTTSTRSIDRIAQNFLQALRRAVAAGADIVVLGDHDDLWHVDRVAHQVALVSGHPSIAMVASDGYLIDAEGVALPGTLRTNFPIPKDFAQLTSRKQLAFALRHSVATGAASAIRPSALTNWTIPRGWLHDRWWSLSAIRSGALLLDSKPVIDYRVSPSQQVGLDLAEQDRSLRWLWGKTRNAADSARRVRDVSRLSRS